MYVSVGSFPYSGSLRFVDNGRVIHYMAEVSSDIATVKTKCIAIITLIFTLTLTLTLRVQNKLSTI